MYRICRGTISIIFLAVFAGSAGVLAGESIRPDMKKDIHAARSIFDRNGGEYDLRSFRENETLVLPGKKLDSPALSAFEMMSMRGGRARSAPGTGSKRKIAVSMLASALLPGLGELYLYMDRGDWSDWSTLARVPVFMAVDGYLWYARKDNYDLGKDYKRQYEEYCDEHWSEDRFLQQFPNCEGGLLCDDWKQYNEEMKNSLYYFVYIPRYLDREEYYENCGKYDAFVFGWDDWDMEAWDGTYENLVRWTPNRTTYWDLRIESDKYLVRADQHLMLLIVNRVISAIDAGWLAYRLNRGDIDSGGWSLDLQPDAVTPTIGISYRF